MKLQSYVGGKWRSGDGQGILMRDASTGEIVAEAGSAGIDFAATLAYARDGGIGTVFAFASKAGRELPNSRVYLDGSVEALSKTGTFMGQHIYVSREGAAVHINAFNFPVWGMLEKFAPTILAGMPVIVKPATATAYLAELVARRMVESGLLPEGALQIVCGGLGNLFDHLTCQDSVAFTGSADTASRLRVHPAIVRNAVPFIAETDSLNCSVLAADAAPGTPEFDLFIKEVTREMTAKTGQKCTAIRRALVPAEFTADAVTALQAALKKIVVGDPRSEGVRMGPLVSMDQRTDVLARVADLRREADLVSGDPNHVDLRDADSKRGAFVPPLLLLCRDPHAARAVHDVEAFGPVATILSYRGTADAIALARRGGGSLAASVFTADHALASELALGLAPYHGRILVVDRTCAKESTGHGSPLAPLIHGGPGRAGGGEEMGGIRGVLHYMQRAAIQGSPDSLTAVGGRWVRGSRERDPGVHPFRIAFNELQLGDTFKSSEREVTVTDIERFAELSGDTFYAHMDEAQAARNPLFGGRVAHGYFLISAAAGLFVDPDYGPVLGNYGLDNLRFVKPVKPGDRIKVRLSCAHKSLRAEKGWGEVGWDTEITNQLGETCASYTVLTMVSIHAVPDSVS